LMCEGLREVHEAIIPHLAAICRNRSGRPARKMLNQTGGRFDVVAVQTTRPNAKAKSRANAPRTTPKQGYLAYTRRKILVTLSPAPSQSPPTRRRHHPQMRSAAQY
jgi:hypothetical protein